MWVRKRLDIGWADLAAAGLSPGWAGRQVDWAARAEQAWLDPRQALAILSVRSGLDLLLETLQLPPGSEVLMSAFTIPAMARIVAAHQLVPVPVDISLETMGPDPVCLRRALTPRSRILVAAHLLGGRFPLEPVAEIAREHRLLLVEDCAQAFDGGTFRGSAEADVSMFSFGLIKTATALGGGLLRVRDAELRAALRRQHEQWPLQPRRALATRLSYVAVLKALSSRPLFATLVHGCTALGLPYDRFVNGTVRGFSEQQFFDRIRQRPSAPLLALLTRRLRGYDQQRVAIRTRYGRLLTEWLSEAVLCPGSRLEPHTYWVFPIVVEDPQEVIRALRRAGFDATQGQSMCAVAPPPERPELRPQVAADLMEKVVYLPLYSALSEATLRCMAAAIRRVAQRPTFAESHAHTSVSRGAKESGIPAG